MKAMLQHDYGAPREVLEAGDIDPPEPGAHQVLLRVHASAVNPADWMQVTGRPYVARLGIGLRHPKHPVRGRDVAGTIESVGSKATRLRPGAEVYGELPGGAFAEYAVAAEDAVTVKPVGIGFPEAAAVPLAGVTALQALRDAGGVRAGHRVLVNGASGGVGTFAVQIAKSFGAHLTGVCSTRNLELVRSIGADEAIDYTREDFTRPDRTYDVVFDLVGNHPPSAYRRVLSRGGVYVAASGMPGGDILGPLPYLLRGALSALRPGLRAKAFAAKPNANDLATLTEMIEAGALRPIIDRSYPLAELDTALTRQGDGHARGKTVVIVADDEPRTR